jgi:hypothetical protein
MTPKSISDRTSLGDEDLFAAEIPKLHRLFVRGVHPTLTDEKRVALWKQIVERLPEEEADLLEHVRRATRASRRQS